jgi:hypothetical protein
MAVRAYAREPDPAFVGLPLTWSAPQPHIGLPEEAALTFRTSHSQHTTEPCMIRKPIRFESEHTLAMATNTTTTGRDRIFLDGMIQQQHGKEPYRKYI